jgi:Protein of unknown function (DUF3800)
MKVIFSDESGVGSEAEEPITVITALMLDLDSQWEPLISDVETTLATTLKGPGQATGYEIKGDRLSKDLRSGRGYREQATQILNGLLSLPTKHQFPIFYGSFDRAGFKKVEDYLKGLRHSLRKVLQASVRVDPAFGEALHHVNTYTDTSVPKEKVLWIHDRNSGVVSKNVELAYLRLQGIARMQHEQLREKGSITFGGGRAGFSIPSSNIHIVDTIYFGNSVDSRLLQLADLYCSIITSHLLVTYGYFGKTHKTAVLAPFYSLIAGQVVNDGVPPALSKNRSWF